MSMIIDDNHLFARHMMCYIIIMRVTNICTRSLNSVLSIQKILSLRLINITYLVLWL